MPGKPNHDIAAALNNIAGTTTHATITTGAFTFDEPTLRHLIREWLELADDYDKSLRRSDAIAKVDGPGLDYASSAQAQAANRSGQAYLSYLQHNRDYCYREAQLCQNALDDYLGVEHRVVTEIGQSGQSLDDGSRRGI
jgi:hypothetical protein